MAIDLNFLNDPFDQFTRLKNQQCFMVDFVLTGNSGNPENFVIFNPTASPVDLWVDSITGSCSVVPIWRFYPLTADPGLAAVTPQQRKLSATATANAVCEQALGARPAHGSAFLETFSVQNQAVLLVGPWQSIEVPPGNGLLLTADALTGGLTLFVTWYEFPG